MNPTNTQMRFSCAECGAENQSPGWCQVCGEGRTEMQQVTLIGPADVSAWADINSPPGSF
jgi:transcription elongation factor Elf1